MAQATTQTKRRQAMAKLSIKQVRFVKNYAHLGNASEAARRAGYKPKAARQMASENLSKPAIDLAVKAELARIGAEVSPMRVKQRLHEISHAAQGAGQFGPAVRAEELLGKSIGMWIDQSIALTGQLGDAHIQALLDTARRRQAEPVELRDEEAHNQAHRLDSDD